MMGKGLTLLVLCVCLFSAIEGQRKRGKPARAPKRRVGAIVKDMEKNMTELWREIKYLSQPVHVHIHGDGHEIGGHGHMMHGGHGGHGDHEGHGDHDGHANHTEEGHMEHGGDHDDDDMQGHGHRGHGGHGHGHGHKKHRGGGRGGHRGHHGHSHDEHDDDDNDHMSGGEHGDDHDEEEEHHSDGTHVHIHLHTGGGEERHDGHRVHAMPVPPPPEQFRYARCDMVKNTAPAPRDQQDIRGTIYFRQMPNEDIEVKADLRGIRIDHRAESDHKHMRALHAHSFGDLSDSCGSTGGHYNPHGVDHGGPHSHDSRHPGDFGNLIVAENGTISYQFKDPLATLFGQETLLGRGLVLHGGADDYGQGGDAGSRASGNAGTRIACCSVLASAEPLGVWAGSGLFDWAS